MTAAAFPPPITCPSSLIASCAPLLGFVPEHSLVVFIHGVPGRRAPVVLRVDLPSPERAEYAAAETTRSICGTRAVAVDAVAWVGARDDDGRDDLSTTPFLAALARHLGAAGIEVGAVLSTNGSVWWSHVCTDPMCCPADATPVDMATVDAVRAEYVFAGVAPLPSREDLADRVARDDPRAAAVAQALATSSPNASGRWRDTSIRFLTHLLLPADGCGNPPRALSVSATARAVRGLGDIRVRDVVLRRVVVSQRDCPQCWAVTIETLSAVLRSAPAGSTAPVATVLALVAWMRGEGALASVSLQRAAEDPPYRLAELATRLMARGTDPRIWRESLATLTEAECRNPSGR